MFVSIDRLLPPNYLMRLNSSSFFQENIRTSSMNKQCYPISPSIYESICDCEKNDLKIGDRVIWLSRVEPVPGTVEWLGFSESNQLKVSVQLDYPVGLEYNTTITVPALELVKASDFYDNEGSCRVNGDSSWEAGAANNKEGTSKYSQATQEFITRSPPLTYGYDDGASSGNEGNGYYDIPDSSNSESLSIGSLVEVLINNKPNYGVIRWIGTVSGDRKSHKYAGIEMEKDIGKMGCESLCGHKYFQCKPERCLYIRLNECKTDLRFQDVPHKRHHRKKNNDGASSESEGSGYYDTPDSSSVESFSVGSLVEVSVNGEPNYGVIRWIGTVPGEKKSPKYAGIEMENDLSGFGCETLYGRKYFHCKPERSLYIRLSLCKRDSRFQDNPYQKHPSKKSEDFGCMESPIIPGVIPPISKEGDITSICGKNRGIQGHHNSCYLDATLFSMFTFTSVFDNLLYRPALYNDIPHYQLIQKVLREEIVNPLRMNFYVRADRVMKLRTLMKEELKDVSFTTEEKDPEEFLTSLVAQILKAEPFLKLSSGQEAYHYQLFVEKNEALVFPSVQQLFEQSFLSSDLKLKEVPSVLIVQMPRFGKSFKMYPRILPSQLLDVTDVIEDSPRQCTVCGNLAEFECKECFEQCDVGLQSISFCGHCLERTHNHERRRNHQYKQLSVPVEFTIIKDHCHIPRLYMQLFAVVCIETSHYVTFVKCGSGADAPWCFFDSMADRKGEQNGYNIPEMVACPELPYWLSEKGALDLHSKDERQLPEYAKRLLCDAYMCMYQSTEVMMYR